VLSCLKRSFLVKHDPTVPRAFTFPLKPLFSRFPPFLPLRFRQPVLALDILSRVPFSPNLFISAEFLPSPTSLKLMSPAVPLVPFLFQFFLFSARVTLFPRPAFLTHLSDRKSRMISPGFQTPSSAPRLVGRPSGVAPLPRRPPFQTLFFSPTRLFSSYSDVNVGRFSRWKKSVPSTPALLVSSSTSSCAFCKNPILYFPRP